MTATVERVPAPAAAPRAATPRWVHRPELDGVRTVAVYLVVLFHAGVGLFAGGFIGVDLFFVLSGFLVSSILLDEITRRGSIDVGAFFARRVRRLLPAAVVVVVATSLLAVLTAPVARRLPWIGDAQSALLYVSNWHFLAVSNDYFGADVDTSPFLHFWSLSIEEQFYVGFALVLLLVVRAARRTTHWAGVLTVVVAVLAGASVASQVYWGSHDADRAYYATDARVYQMLAGVLAALLWRRLRAARGEPSRLRLPGAALLLLALTVVVALSVVAVSPSVRGLAATAVAAPMILVVMVDVDPGARWLLTRPVMTYLGRISYGTYLWHWPVVLVLGQLFDVGPAVIALLTAGLATGLAALSSEVLEQPIRRSRSLAPFRFPTVVVGVALSAVVAVTVVPRVLGSDRMPAVARTAPAAAEGPTVLPTGPVPAGLHWKAMSAQHGLDTTYCTPADPGDCLLHRGSGPRVLVVGDSHGRVLGPALLDLAEKHDFTLYGSVISACSWFPHTTTPSQDSSGREQCHAARDHLYPELVRALHIDVVLLDQMPRDWLIFDDHPGEPYPGLAAHAVQDVTAAVTSAGARVVFVRTWLQTMDDPMSCLSGARDISECEQVQTVQGNLLDSYYDTEVAENPDAVATIDVNRVMCPQFPLCAAVLDGLPTWRDRFHYLPENLVAHDGRIWNQLVRTGFLG